MVMDFKYSLMAIRIGDSIRMASLMEMESIFGPMALTIKEVFSLD